MEDPGRPLGQRVRLSGPRRGVMIGIGLLVLLGASARYLAMVDCTVWLHRIYARLQPLPLIGGVLGQGLSQYERYHTMRKIRAAQLYLERHPGARRLLNGANLLGWENYVVLSDPRFAANWDPRGPADYLTSPFVFYWPAGEDGEPWPIYMQGQSVSLDDPTRAYLAPPSGQSPPSPQTRWLQSPLPWYGRRPALGSRWDLHDGIVGANGQASQQWYLGGKGRQVPPSPTHIVPAVIDPLVDAAARWPYEQPGPSDWESFQREGAFLLVKEAWAPYRARVGEIRVNRPELTEAQAMMTVTGNSIIPMANVSMDWYGHNLSTHGYYFVPAFSVTPTCRVTLDDPAVKWISRDDIPIYLEDGSGPFTLSTLPGEGP